VLRFHRKVLWNPRHGAPQRPIRMIKVSSGSFPAASECLYLNVVSNEQNKQDKLSGQDTNEVGSRALSRAVVDTCRAGRG
jgi:hypothetical protein